MSDAIAQAAELMLAARRDPTKKLTALPEALRPRSRAAAYAIQHKIAETFPAIGGWKVSPFGAHTPPMCGPLPAAGVVASPASLAHQQYSTRAIESELSVRIGRDLPPRATPYTREDITAAIAAIHPALELCDSRFVEPKQVDLMSTLADSQSHGGLVYGAPVTDWQKVDLLAESVAQFVDGELNASRVGHPAKDLVGQIVWLANEGSVWAGGLQAGQIVTCGSWTGANRVPPVASIRVQFSTIGEVLFDYVA